MSLSVSLKQTKFPPRNNTSHARNITFTLGEKMSFELQLARSHLWQKFLIHLHTDITCEHWYCATFLLWKSHFDLLISHESPGASAMPVKSHVNQHILKFLDWSYGTVNGNLLGWMHAFEKAFSMICSLSLRAWTRSCNRSSEVFAETCSDLMLLCE